MAPLLEAIESLSEHLDDLESRIEGIETSIDDLHSVALTILQKLNELAD